MFEFRFKGLCYDDDKIVVEYIQKKKKNVRSGPNRPRFYSSTRRLHNLKKFKQARRGKNVKSNVIHMRLTLIDIDNPPPSINSKIIIHIINYYF